MSERLSMEVANLAGRLADFLAAAFPRPEGTLAQNQAFLRAASESAARSVREPPPDQPLDRLIRKLMLEKSDVDLLLLAGMPEEHEGFAAIFRTLHPRGESRPTIGLAAQLFGSGARSAFMERFATARAIRNGLVQAKGDVPFFEKSLEPAPFLWPVLHGNDEWPTSLLRYEGQSSLYGLDEWLATPALARASHALRQQQPCTVLITADSEEIAFHRALAMVNAAGREPAGIILTAPLEPDLLRTLKNHALARAAVPVLRAAAPDGPGVLEAPSFDEFPDVVVIAGRTGAVPVHGSRPLIASFAERLTPSARRSIWSNAFPKLKESAQLLAARYPVEPTAAVEVASDLSCLETLEKRTATVEDLADAMRARSAMSLSGGVRLIRPVATWNQLVVRKDHEEQLRAAINRLDLQARVLDEWGFLEGRPGARGVRMMFSGPPGTGKTLSAEVLAGELKVDLLFVDISRVVSKWIGETEKNLAAVFDMAERARAVLFFDEADALFGRRTEVSDAHDRYANLETAYLLARLERFEGLAILATNLRQNIDPAFLRRLDFVVDFGDPDRDERCRIWRCHIPNEKLLDNDVNLDELATLYPVVGAFIRNAAVAAAFLAAANGGKITRRHFIRAIRREYEKSGKAFPGLPVGMKNC